MSAMTRNLRDGELKLVDDNGVSLTVVLDDGDLSWTETVNTVEVLDRGSIAAGHTRPGDEVPVELSFTAKWTTLVALPTDDDPTLYEFLTVDPTVASTSPAGQQRTISLEFTVTDPAGGPAERITFPKVYRQSLTMTEGEDANRIAFAGRSFAAQPLIERGEAPLPG